MKKMVMIILASCIFQGCVIDLKDMEFHVTGNIKDTKDIPQVVTLSNEIKICFKATLKTPYVVDGENPTDEHCTWFTSGDDGTFDITILGNDLITRYIGDDVNTDVQLSSFKVYLSKDNEELAVGSLNSEKIIKDPKNTGILTIPQVTFIANIE